MTLSGAQELRNRPEPRRVVVAGGTLAVWEAGAGAPVLLLHGISADHTEWRGIARELASEFRLIMPDLLGRGASRPEPEATFTLADETDRVEQLLTTLGVERPLVAGHSNGASLAVSLADRRPVAGLLLLSPVTPWTSKPAPLGLLDSPAVRRSVAPLLRACRRPLTRYILTRRVYGQHAPVIDDAVDRYAAPYADPARSAALLRILRDWEPRALARIAPPSDTEIRVATGAEDRRIAPAQVARWAERLGATLTVVERAGHGLTEEEPRRMAAILRDIHVNADT